MWKEYFTSEISFEYNTFKVKYEDTKTRFKFYKNTSLKSIAPDYKFVVFPLPKPRTRTFLKRVASKITIIRRFSQLCDDQYYYMNQTKSQISMVMQQQLFSNQSVLCLYILDMVQIIGKEFLIDFDIANKYSKDLTPLNQTFLLTNILRYFCSSSNIKIMTYDMIYSIPVSSNSIKYMFGIKPNKYAIAVRNYVANTMTYYRKIHKGEIINILIQKCPIFKYIMNMKSVYLTGKWLYMILTGNSEFYEPDEIEYICRDATEYIELMHKVNMISTNKNIKIHYENILSTSLFYKACFNADKCFMSPQYAVAIITKTLWLIDSFSEIDPNISQCGIGYLVYLNNTEYISQIDNCYKFIKL